MTTLIGLAVVIVGVLGGVGWAVFNPDFDWIEKIMFGVLNLLWPPLLGFLVVTGLTAAANVVFDHDDQYANLEIVAIRDGSGQVGTYVFGSGASGPTGTYMFYYLDGDAKRLAKIDASEVRLYEDSTKPYAIMFTGCELSVRWVAPCFYEKAQFVEIHVPAGSVRSGVDLSLNGN